MGYLGRRIGVSQDKGNSTPASVDGAVGGGILDLVASGYFQRQGKTYNAPGIAPQGMSATGGIISDYTTTPGAVYRAHVFTASGAFTVNGLGTYGNTIEYVVVAGGGGGSSRHGGGGGGGGLLVSPGSFGVPTSQNQGSTIPIPSSTPAPFSVTIGAGGRGGHPGGAPVTGPSAEIGGAQGSPSSLGPVSTTGGGGGAGYPYPNTSVQPQQPGGSGGGGANLPSAGAGGAATNYPGPTQQGFPGGAGGPANAHHAGGGGGAGAAGDDGGPGSSPAPGGNGLQIAIAGPAADTTGVGGLNPGPGEYQWFAGGGGGNGESGAAGGTGGAGGGGAGSPSNTTDGIEGQANTGGGGGGARSGQSGHGAAGGSGVVIVRYQIAEVATQKATGGSVSYYGGKTIHTFVTSGTFIAPGSFSETCEYVVLGGGASGGSCAGSNGGGGGGGGAGSYRTGTTPISGPSTTTIQVGAGGASPGIAGNFHGIVGTPSYLGTPITAPTGGYGAMADGSPKTGGGPGGSGGGGGGGGGTGDNANPGPSTGSPFPGTIGSSPTSGWGHDGGAGVTGGQGYSGGGGGGAGGGGVAGTYGTNGKGGNGGLGIQLPSSFRNPASTVGHPGPTSPSVTGADTSGKYYVAGGGGGGINPMGGGTPDKGYGGVGPGTTTSRFAGAGDAGKNAPGSNADQSSGSGGGGTGGDSAGYAGNGGSGLVLIAYPT